MLNHLFGLGRHYRQTRDGPIFGSSSSNMRDEWNGLQALFLKECPYVYYVHCMAHRLQLALVTTYREVKFVHQFFDHLTNIINIVVGSSKLNDELQYA